MSELKIIEKIGFWYDFRDWTGYYIYTNEGLGYKVRIG